MNTKTKTAIAVGIVFLVVGAAREASAAATFAFGPIEQLDSRSVTVLGQNYLLEKVKGSSTRLSVGTFVLIEGDINDRGVNSARTLKIAKSPYVPGASDVAVSGVVRSYDATKGLLTIGALDVYALDAVTVLPADLGLGAEVQVLGRQSNPSGLLWASEIRVTAKANVQPVPTAQAIEGTGRAFSAQAIEGTGKAAGTQAIEGTGSAVSAQAIEGTGKAISAQAIEGTGSAVSTQAIEGTGKIISTQAIEGTGKSLSTQAIEGTGRAAY